MLHTVDPVGMACDALGVSTPRPNQPPPLPFIPHPRAPDLWLDVGHVRRPPRFPSHRPHRMGFFELLLLTRGKGRGQLGGEPIELRPGSVLLAAADEVMALELDAGAERFVLCLREGFLAGTEEPFLLRRLGLFRRSGSRRQLHLRPEERDWLESRLAGMAEEIDLLDAHSRGILRAQLLETLHRAERIARRDLPEELAGASSPWAERFLAVLESTYLEEHRVDTLARHMGLSPAHLHTRVKECFGSSPKRLISQRLMLEAKRRLDGTEKSVAQVAGELGFADPAYFSRFFRRWAGQSPGAYRRQS